MSTRRRFGSLRKQRNGRWQARYKGPDGRERQGPTTFATKTDAARWLDGVGSDMQRGSWSDPKDQAVTLGTYAADWLKQRRLAPRTAELYSDLLRLHLVPQLGCMPIGKITPADVRRWHSGRLDSTGRTRTRQSYALLRSVLGTAVRDGLLPSNPCAIVGAGQNTNPERPYLSRKQAELLADAMPADMRVLVITTLWSHLRLGELLAVRREDVDLTAGTMHIHRAISRTRTGPIETTTKTKRGRTVHLPRQAIEELRRHLELTGPALPSARLFTHSSGRLLEAHHIRVAWTRARGAVGLQQYHWHDLRHAGLTYVAQRGASTKEIMARGGHSTPAAAMIYQHAAESRDADLAAMLSDDSTDSREQGFLS